MPEESDPYDSRGDIYGYAGRIDRAIESFEEALAREPKYASRVKLGQMYMYKREYGSAKASFQELLGDE